MYRQIPGIALLGSLLLCRAAAVCGQDLEPRSYTNLPIDLTFVGVAYGRSDGEVSPTPSAPVRDMQLTIDTTLVAASHTFALAGESAKVDLIATRTCFDGSATFRGTAVDGQRCDYGDPTARLTWNFYGAPALSLDDFGSWDNGLVIGASLKLGIPVGSYSADNLINAGANRWIVQPGLGSSIRTGPFQWETKVTASFFEENNDFFLHTTLEQEPLYTVSGHVIYTMPMQRWMSLDANYFRGGETTWDGEKTDDRQDNSRLGITFSTPITRQQSIKLFASTGMTTRIGNDFHTYGIAWLYRL